MLLLGRCVLLGALAWGQRPPRSGPKARRSKGRRDGARRLEDTVRLHDGQRRLEDDWTDGPAGFCEGEEGIMGEMASREDCIDTCDDEGYKAMTWDTISTACYCFIEEWCDCVEEYDPEDADDWCQTVLRNPIQTF